MNVKLSSGIDCSATGAAAVVAWRLICGGVLEFLDNHRIQVGEMEWRKKLIVERTEEQEVESTVKETLSLILLGQWVEYFIVITPSPDFLGWLATLLIEAANKKF